MTDPHPRDVWFEIEAELYHPTLGSETVHVENIVPSVDMDRVPFCAAEITLTRVTDEAWVALDSRVEDPPRFRFRIFERAFDEASDPETLTSLPRVGLGDGNQTGELVIRSATRDRKTGQVTVRAQGRESLLDDKRRIAASTINTAAANVSALIYWSLNDVFGGFAISEDAIVGATLLPDGDRRRMLRGETHSDLIEPELQAIGCRLYDQWGRLWWAIARDDAPTFTGAQTVVKLAGYEISEGAPEDSDPIVHEMDETVTRDGDWADAVLVHGQYTDQDEARHEWWEPSGDGSNTRGRVINVDRPKPANGLADALASRTVIRGHTFTVKARPRFDVLPGMDLEVYLPGEVVTGIIRAVEWDIADSLMTIRAQTGAPIDG